MFEIIIFVIAFTLAQVVAGFVMMGIMMKLMTSKRFIVNYYKKVMALMNELSEEDLI